MDNVEFYFIPQSQNILHKSLTQVNTVSIVILLFIINLLFEIYCIICDNMQANLYAIFIIWTFMLVVFSMLSFKLRILQVYAMLLLYPFLALWKSWNFDTQHGTADMLKALSSVWKLRLFLY